MELQGDHRTQPGRPIDIWLIPSNPRAQPILFNKLYQPGRLMPDSRRLAISATYRRPPDSAPTAPACRRHAARGSCVTGRKNGGIRALRSLAGRTRKFIDMMRHDKFPVPIFKDKGDCPGLQAADYLAWQQGNYLKGKRSRPTIKPNEAFSRLLSIPHIHRAQTLSSLLDACEKRGVEIKRSKVIIP